MKRPRAKRFRKIVLDVLFSIGMGSQLILWLGLLVALTPVYYKY